MADTDDTSRRAPESEPRFVALKDASLILGLQFFLMIFRLGQIPLIGPDEPRYARVAVEMARANEFVTPTLAGEAWLEKPPLYYWLAGFGYWMLGENETAARVPAVLAALVMTGFTGLVAARLFGAGCGRIAMLILATSPLVFAYGRAATMDMLVAAFITGASGLFILSILGISGPSAIPAAWGLMGIAVLAKGPIGFLIPLCIGVVMSLALRRFAVSRLVTPLAIAFLAAIALPWFVAIYLDQGFHFIEVFILNHNLQRFTSTVHNHPGPFYYYIPVLLLGVFPWSGLAALAPGATRKMTHETKWALGAWILVPLILFSLAGSKLPGYILPCLPPFAILLAVGARDLRPHDQQKAAFRIAGLVGLIISALLLAASLRAMRDGLPWGRSALAPSAWALALTFFVSRSLDIERARAESLRLLSIGAAGFLLLLTLVAPPVLEAMESGRRLFLPANGREVVVVGAWRTAWMSGYFYNNGKVRELGKDEPMSVEAGETRLVLFGPVEWEKVQSSAQFSVLQLARGPRGNVLAKVSNRSGH